MTDTMATLLDEGLVLMVMGMGTVFIFLCIMVFSMGLMSKVVGYLNKVFPEQICESGKPSKRTNVSEDEAVAVAIAVAYSKG